MKCLSNSEISSPEKQSATKLLHMQRQYLKPPKFDGSTAFELFLVQFQNCASFNRRNRIEQLEFLRAALEKEAAQVLWDYNEAEVNSVKKLIWKLRHRFGGASQPEKYRIWKQSVDVGSQEKPCSICMPTFVDSQHWHFRSLRIELVKL